MHHRKNTQQNTTKVPNKMPQKHPTKCHKSTQQNAAKNASTNGDDASRGKMQCSYTKYRLADSTNYTSVCELLP